MSWNSKCTYCGYVSHPDAEVCERCAFPLGADAHDSAGVPPYAYDAAPRASVGRVPSTRFGSAGDVIPPMLEVFRKHFHLVIIFVVVATSAEMLLRYLLLATLPQSAVAAEAVKAFPPGSVFAAKGVVGGIPMWFGTQATQALLAGSLAYAVLDLQYAGATSAGACLRRGLKSLPKVFIITMLSTVATYIGYALLFIPGVIFNVTYALAIPAAVAENAGVYKSFERSSELTTGYRWHIFATYFLWGVAVAAINYVVSLSFMHTGQRDSLASVTVQALVSSVLNSTMAVLGVFIFLGLLREKGQGLDASAFASETAPAER